MKKARILIVDDDKNILITLHKALEMFEYDIDEAETGNAACAMLENNTYDCILLDLRLQDIDGLEILRRYNPENVIMITAHGTIDNAVEAMKLGCVDYLRKPFDLDLVRNSVRQVLERKHLAFKQVMEFESLIQVAKLHVQNRQFRKAIETVKHALEIRPDSSEAYNILGVLHEVLDELPLAVTAYQTAIRLNPENDSAKDNLARMRNLDHSSGLKLDF